MRSLVRAALVLAVSFGFVGSISNAATLDLTDVVGQTVASGDSGAVTYSGDAAFGVVTFAANPAGSDLTWSKGNGLGINCPITIPGCFVDSPYQIDAPESLTVTFEKALFLSSVDIGMLSTTGRCFLRLDEQGSIVGSDFVIAFDSDYATNGRLTVPVNRMVKSIRLVPDRGEWNDFTLAGISIGRVTPAPSNPIPEPSSVLLMLIGGGIVAARVRKHIAASGVAEVRHHLVRE